LLTVYVNIVKYIWNTAGTRRCRLDKGNTLKKILKITPVVSLLVSLLVLSLVLTGCPLARPSASSPGGGVLNLYGVDPTTLDPAMSSDAGSHEYILQIFSGLVRLDENLEPAPDIARKWDISEDGRVYTFYLRDNVKFHSGRAVTAHDFKYSWERAASPSTGSQTAG
jgi:oligopeptide transport system substrate-binding protein